MSEINNGGPAFPRPFSADDIDHDISYPAHAGMDLRDYFAAKAMAALIAHPNGRAGQWDDAAKEAYLAADAMLRAREQP